MSSARRSGAIAGWRAALIVCVLVVLIDQVSKSIVTSSIGQGQSESLLLGFKLTNTPNAGLAFGIGQGHGVVLVVTIIALALVLLWFALDPARPGLWLAGQFAPERGHARELGLDPAGMDGERLGRERFVGHDRLVEWQHRRQP